MSLFPSSFVCKKLKIKIYKTIILPVVLCSCETWSLTLREQHRLRVSENRELRIILEPKTEKVTGWKKLHNEVLHNMYFTPTIMQIKSRKVGCARYVARMGKMRNAYNILVRIPRRKRPFGKLRCK